MATGQYAVETTAKTQRQVMKRSFKQKFRSWLFDEESSPQISSLGMVEEAKLQSEGMRLQIYKASGGYVVETRSYDGLKDRSGCKMFVIKEEDDLGAELGKIVMMEALRG